MRYHLFRLYGLSPFLALANIVLSLGAEAELDVVELAIYGSIFRPTLHCRVKSVAEASGLVKQRSRELTHLTCDRPTEDTQLPPTSTP